MKRYAFLAILAFGLAVSCTRALYAADKPGTVRIGYFGSVNAQLLAKHLDLDAHAMGVPVQWVKFSSGRDILTALASGSIDIGELGNVPAAIAISKGLPVQGVYVAHLAGSGVALVARPGLGIRSLADLVGKTVAVPFGTNPHYLLVTALKLAGVDPKRVRLIDMSPKEIYAAFARGNIDAGYVWQPTLSKLLEAGGAVILTSADMAKKGYPTGDVEVVRKSFAQRYPNLVAGFVRGESEAARIWLTQPQRAAELVAAELSMPVSSARQLMSGVEVLPLRTQLGPEYLGTSERVGALADNLQSVADFLVRQGRLRSVPAHEAFADFVDPAYLERVAKSAAKP